ncbi:carboxy terminal-processing peptidase [Saprospiraceae bacterium]|nr:carboxy terminal-processing peptidase [Saprospiraceae bacterium]
MRVISIVIAVFVSLFLMSSYADTDKLLSQSIDKRESTIIYSLMGIVDYLHFKPKKINDKFSAKVFNEYLDRVDGAKRFLIQEEIEALKQYEKEIDNDIDRFGFSFFDLSVDLMDQSVDRAEELYNEIINTDFTLDINEEYETDGEKKMYAKNVEALKDDWRKALKFNIVSRIASYEDDDELKLLSSDDKYIKAKGQVKDLFDDWFSRLQKTRRADRFDEYINTIMTQFDPHSYYFSPKEKENFDIKMGNKLEGIGAQLQPAKDYIRVFSIVPGGPAWKGEELEVDDLIVAVTQENSETVDITGMRMDDVIRMIRGDKGTNVTLRVKKKDGSFQNITIERDEIILDDAAARSAIINMADSDEKVGYINLPLFYSTFDGGNSCATDVEKELEKLSESNVDGIILDLRYNGGGSLPDVITMAGLFIEEGPVLQVKGREKKPQVHYDKDKSVSYDGPLIVLVNEVSASSSEILVGALQDYGRAVIVGGERTFGKGTVQGVYDLDRMYQEDDGIKPLGQVKLTTQKFYRISGSSNQLDGVIPDVIIPDQFSYTEYGEQELDGALTNSKIEALDFTQDIYNVKNLDELQKNSSLRISQSDDFDKVKAYGKLLKSLDDNSSVSLKLTTYAENENAREALLEPFSDLFEENVEGLVVSNLEADLAYMNEDKSRVARNDDFISNLQKDFYLKESFMIMKDMLSIDARLANK